MELPAKALFPIPEVAELTGVPRSTLYKQIKDGAIPEEHIVTIGHSYMTRAHVCTLLGIEDPYPIRFQAPAGVAS